MDLTLGLKWPRTLAGYRCQGWRTLRARPRRPPKSLRGLSRPQRRPLDMIHDPDRLQQGLGKPTLARLIQGIAARLRFGQSLGGTLTLPDVSADERSAIDHFLGRRPSSGTPLVVRLAEMERILCESGMCDSLAEAVQAIAGPIEDQRRARDSASHRWTDLFSSIEAAMADLPQYRDWLARICSTGLLPKYSRDHFLFPGLPF